MATIEFDNLFNEAYPKTKRYLTLKSGQSIVRGEAIALETSTGKLITYSDADKATAPFFGISPTETDATGGDIEGVEIITGCEVNANAIVFSDTDDSVTETLTQEWRLKGVHIVPFISGDVGTV